MSSQTITVDGFEISISCADGFPPISYAPDGSPIVHVGAKTAVLVATSPSYMWKNVPGNLDGRMPEPLGSPLSCRAGDSVILAMRATQQRAPRPEYYDAAGRSEISKMVCVSFTKHPLSEPLLRSFGIGRGFVIEQLLRGYEIPTSQVNVNALPRTLNIPEAEFVPLLAYAEKIFGKFCGEVGAGHGSDYITPDLQHPGYGSYLSSCVSIALVLLCANVPAHRKRRLATLTVQWGVDLAGAFCQSPDILPGVVQGRKNTSNGGHMQGRKALIILAGYLLGIPQMTNPDVHTRDFQETHAYETVPGNGWWFGWPHIWHPFGRGSGDFVNRPPATWTDDSAGHRGERFMLSYMSQVVASQVGTALAMHLMGLSKEMGLPHFGMISQWMDGPPQSVIEELRAASSESAPLGLSYPWGTDYRVGPGEGLCANAWRQAKGLGLIHF